MGRCAEGAVYPVGAGVAGAVNAYAVEVFVVGVDVVDVEQGVGGGGAVPYCAGVEEVFYFVGCRAVATVHAVPSECDAAVAQVGTHEPDFGAGVGRAEVEDGLAEAVGEGDIAAVGSKGLGSGGVYAALSVDYDAQWSVVDADVVVFGFVGVVVIEYGQHEVALAVVFEGGVEDDSVPTGCGGHGAGIDQLQGGGVNEVVGGVEFAAGGMSEVYARFVAGGGGVYGSEVHAEGLYGAVSREIGGIEYLL